jgi:uncharacterized protein YjiS (DUF1127 family)
MIELTQATTLAAETTPHAAEMPTAQQGLAQRLLSAIARQQQRKALALLDQHQLADIGISREAAVKEAAKPFWE